MIDGLSLRCFKKGNGKASGRLILIKSLKSRFVTKNNGIDGPDYCSWQEFAGFETEFVLDNSPECAGHILFKIGGVILNDSLMNTLEVTLKNGMIVFVKDKQLDRTYECIVS
jgi:hypothetical protein